jgi:hypothetical protein
MNGMDRMDRNIFNHGWTRINMDADAKMFTEENGDNEGGRDGRV